MDASAWINVLLLVFTAIGAIAAWRGATAAGKERLASEVARRESEAARDETIRLAAEANALLNRQADAQEKLAAAQEPQPWVRIDKSLGNSSLIEFRQNGDTTFEEVSISIVPDDGDLVIETTPEEMTDGAPGNRVHPGRSVVLRHAPTYDGSPRHDVTIRWKVANSDGHDRCEFTVV